jgi:hypothetical protein
VYVQTNDVARACDATGTNQNIPRAAEAVRYIMTVSSPTLEHVAFCALISSEQAMKEAMYAQRVAELKPLREQEMKVRMLIDR